MTLVVELAGPVVGKGFTELYDLVKGTITKVVIFKTKLQKLKSTLDSLTPVVEEIKRSNRVLDRPGPETEMFTEIFKKAKQIVENCSEVGRWNLFDRYFYAKKLQKLDGLILRFFQLDVQAQMMRTVNEILMEMREMAGSSRGTASIDSVPEPPDFTLGLDAPLKEIRNDLFKEGGQLIVVSGAGGSGKTTMVTKLCKDDQVKVKFQDNIFYVTVSKTPNVKVIVRKIFEQKRSPVPEIQTDDEATNDLKQFLNERGSKDILLVLDDVWRGSTSMVHKFKSQLTEYKILVTSRSRFVFHQSEIRRELKPLKEDTAITLFRHSAGLTDENSYDRATIEKIVKSCKGSPLALTVVGRSLCGRPEAVWKKRAEDFTKHAHILIDNDEILDCLQSSLDVLDDKLKECFMDLGSFPEDQRIPATAFIDMWRELYELDNDFDVIFNLCELSDQILVNLEVPGKNPSDDGCYNDYFVTQHDLLRDLIIHQIKLEPEEERKRLFIEIKGNEFPKWCSDKKQQPVKARIMSISTDEEFSSSWHDRLDLKAPEVEVLVLHIQSKKFILPKFVEEMKKMKVLLVSNNGFFSTELSEFQRLGLIPDLKRISLENVSIPSFDISKMQMENLQKISLVRCNIGQVFENSTFHISHTCGNLKEIEIDYCNDLKNLPDDLCEIVSIMKLSITNCHNLRELPKGLGKLKNLQVLRLASCTDLVALPDTIGSLSTLNLLDISECLEIKELPIQIGDLRSLTKLCMKGCSRCKVPTSIRKLKNLRIVKCDEETTFTWESFKLDLSNLRIEKVEEDINAFIRRLPSIGS